MRIKTDSFDLAVYAKGDEKAEKLALILPGQLDTKDYPHTRSHTDFLASKGFYALSFDPPGTWETSDDISQYTMTNYFKAINELVEYFGNKPTLFMGHSRGGAMAMLAGTTNPHALAFVSVFSNYTYDQKINTTYNDDEWKAKGFKESWRDLPEGPDRKRLFKLPYAFVEDQMKYGMSDGLSSCSKPKLFFLGLKDALIKPETVRAAYEIAAEPKQLCELDSDHDYRWHPELIEKVNQIIDDFLSHNQL
jgi:pimeloyl-ACP methyl ester carboxylesterase